MKTNSEPKFNSANKLADKLSVSGWTVEKRGKKSVVYTKAMPKRIEKQETNQSTLVTQKKQD